jgi:4-amino-4-deoxy-L-arabinose transferase-like glycosyltransferase
MIDNFNAFISKLKRVAKVIFVPLALLYLFSLFFRRFNGDEGIIGEWAYWLAKTGKAQSLLYFDYFGEKARSLSIYHKFYTLVLSWIIRLFGFRLFLLRMVSLIAFIGLLFLVKKYLRSNHYRSIGLIAFIFLINPLVFNFSFVARPELLMSFFTLFVFILLDYYVNTRKWYWAALAGIIAGLSFFTHLNGIAIIVAGGLFLFFYFSWRAVLGYSILSFLFANLYFIDVTGGYTGFISDLLNSPDMSKSGFSLGDFVMKIIDEQQRFFHNIGLSIYSVLFFVALGLTFKTQIKKNRPVLIFLSLLVLGLSILTHGKTNKYLLYYIPFMAMIILSSINILIGLQKRKQLIIIALFVLLSTISTVYGYLNENLFFINIYNRNREMASYIPAGSTVLANDGFVYGQLENYQIRSPIIFFFTHPGFQENGIEDRLEYFQYAEEKNYDFVAIDMLVERAEIRKFIGFNQLNEQDTLGSFLLKVKTPDFLIFQRLLENKN